VDEVTIVSDTMFDNSIDPATGKPKHSVIGVGTFRGYAEPRYLTTLTSGIDLFNHKLRIQNLFDWRGGNRYYNNTERIRCTTPELQRPVQPGRIAPRTGDGRGGDLRSGKDARRLHAAAGAFVKWREATVTLGVAATSDLTHPRTQREPGFRGAQHQEVDELPRQRSGKRLHGNRRWRLAERVPDVRGAHRCSSSVSTSASDPFDTMDMRILNSSGRAVVTTIALACRRELATCDTGKSRTARGDESVDHRDDRSGHYY